jgi:diaminohydroxyphosphoribosylaminopyrimidine deaminase/5-amino-6-(5-phosphoribosylamino)uracil reductase
MQRALALAAGAHASTVPNPMVGAVLVRDGEVVGQGRHERAGEAHAEVLALRQAGARAAGATLYVTLEPCAHHGRTPPCADAVVAARVSRVVVAMADPDPRVAGAGLRRLRDAGLAVEVGDGREAAEALNPRWLAARRANRPFVALKLAMSLDGRIATAAGESRWITGPAARAEGHRLRAVYAAVAVGAGTVLADDPELTARDAGGAPLPRQPLRVVVDGRLRIPRTARILDPALPGRTVIATSAAAAGAHGELEPWLAVLPGGGEAGDAGATSPRDGRDHQVDLRELLAYLAADGIDSLLVEGGGELAWGFIAAGLVDHVHAFVAPRILGGRVAVPAVGGEGFAALADSLSLRFVSHRVVGDDLLLEAVPVAPPAAVEDAATPGGGWRGDAVYRGPVPRWVQSPRQDPRGRDGIDPIAIPLGDT